MNMLQKKRWVQKKLPDRTVLESLQKQLNINDILATLISQRGITTYDEANEFFNPTAEYLINPFEMKGMDKAVRRIRKAIDKNQKILIYGDYDVDGTTAVALLYNYFSCFYRNIDFYIPDRFNEGYGISYDGINYALENDVKLIIALDCGIKDNTKIEFANQHNIDVIICDHHTPGAEIPDAYSVLNPKQPGCKYPYKELSGCGIGFKLAQAFTQFENNKIDILQYLDFVAVSIASDIVPITGENRVLTHLGLKKLNENPNIGFKALIEANKLNKTLNVTDIVFIIGPRLNASGRIAHARDSVKLLISTDFDEAMEYAGNINSINYERKDIDQSITEEALKMISSDDELQKRKTTILFNSEWHKGVVGIVASRIIENFYRPTIILTESEGYIVGSARSIAGFNLYESLEECSDLFVSFGGHQYAAGVTLLPENLEKFRNRFEEIAGKFITEEMLIPTVEYDYELKFSNISDKLIKILDRFAPFGPGNMRPRFITRNVMIADIPRKVGSNHLKMNLKDENGRVFDAIAFGFADYLELIKDGRPFDVCYSLEENRWNGHVSIQLNIKDMQVQ